MKPVPEVSFMIAVFGVFGAFTSLSTTVLDAAFAGIEKLPALMV
jgi:hypothetical protein